MKIIDSSHERPGFFFFYLKLYHRQRVLCRGKTEKRFRLIDTGQRKKQAAPKRYVLPTGTFRHGYFSWRNHR